MNYDYTLLKQKLKQLPRETQAALTSISIANTIKEIGTRHGLKLDQEEVLYDQTAYVMLGLMPSNEFVKNFSKETGIDSETATAIAQDINSEVFGKLKSSMRSVEAEIQENFNQKQNNDVSSLERVGGFSVEPPANLPGAEEEVGGQDGAGASTESRESMISGLENPAWSTPTPQKSRPASQPSIPRPDLGRTESPHTEAIVDHLLSQPTSQPQQKVVQKPIDSSPTTPKPTNPPQKRGPDSYREPIE